MLNSLLDWEIEVIKWLSEHRLEWAEAFFHILNFIGDELFITLMLPIIYWLFSKRIGFRLGIVIFVSLYTNVLLKDTFQALRPFLADESIVPLKEQDGFSFPSGHAMHSAALWGFLALSVKRKVLYWIAAILILCIGFARVYSGVHFVRDVFSGWVLGAIIAVLVVWGSHQLSKRRVHDGLLIIAVLIISMLGLLIYYGLTENGLDQKGVYQACALAVFAVVGYVWEKRAIRFMIPQSWARKMIACLIGIAGILLIKEGVKLILPEHLWSDYIRYGIIGFWTIALAPYVFVKLKLYEQSNQSVTERLK